MNQFINDMIHMTEGEKLISYYPLWLGIVAIAVIVTAVSYKKKK